MTFVLKRLWLFFKTFVRAWFLDGRMRDDCKTLYKFYRKKTDVVFYCESVMHLQWVSSTMRNLPPNIKYQLITPYKGAGSGLYLSHFGACFIRTKVLVSAVSAPVFPKWSAPYRIHMPHSLVSFHMIYFPYCFDNYNYFYCCGEHHVSEIMEIAKVRKINGVVTERVGYGKLDLLCEKNTKYLVVNQRPTVLLAPSWGKKNILECIGEKLIRAMLASNFDVIIRPHPNFLYHHAYVAIQEVFKNNEHISFENPNDESEAMFYSDIMISDYSGVAYEYAFLRDKPVVFVDVPMKINNPDWEGYHLDPMEIALRDKVGIVVENEASSIVEGVLFLLKNNEKFRKKITSIKSDYVFNFGQCGEVAAEKIISLIAGEHGLSESLPKRKYQDE